MLPTYFSGHSQPLLCSTLAWAPQSSPPPLLNMLCSVSYDFCQSGPTHFGLGLTTRLALASTPFGPSFSPLQGPVGVILFPAFPSYLAPSACFLTFFPFKNQLVPKPVQLETRAWVLLPAPTLPWWLATKTTEWVLQQQTGYHGASDGFAELWQDTWKRQFQRNQATQMKPVLVEVKLSWVKIHETQGALWYIVRQKEFVSNCANLCQYLIRPKVSEG